MLFFGGCKKSNVPDGHCSVSGIVTLDSEPLKDGSISFTPNEVGKRGSSTNIVDGKYALKNQQALLPGEYTVKINASRRYDLKTKQDAPPDADDTEVGFESIVPEKYNKKTTLTASVTEKGSNTFDFELDSNKK